MVSRNMSLNWIRTPHLHLLHAAPHLTSVVGVRRGAGYTLIDLGWPRVAVIVKLNCLGSYFTTHVTSGQKILSSGQ